MPSCRSALSVLLLMTVTLCTVCESAVPVVKVQLNGTAVLTCSERCSGVVRWSMFSKPSEVLAECDQTSCRSVKEGYQMIYNQYLQGDLSLIITEADFSKRGTYTCDCDGKDKCDVVLQIETLKTTVKMKPGDHLLLELHISDPVEVIYSSAGAAGLSNIQICKVNRRSVELSRVYSERASVSSALKLKELKESDSGVYTVRDTFNEEIIHIYTVIVHGVSGDFGAHGKEENSGQGADLPGWVVAVLVVLGVMFVVSVVGNVVQWRTSQRPQRGSMRNGNPQNPTNPLTYLYRNGGLE